MLYCININHISYKVYGIDFIVLYFYEQYEPIYNVLQLVVIDSKVIHGYYIIIDINYKHFIIIMTKY